MKTWKGREIQGPERFSHKSCHPAREETLANPPSVPPLFCAPILCTHGALFVPLEVVVLVISYERA